MLSLTIELNRNILLGGVGVIPRAAIQKTNLQRKIVPTKKAAVRSHSVIFLQCWMCLNWFLVSNSCQGYQKIAGPMCVVLSFVLCVSTRCTRFMPCFLNDLKITSPCLLGSYSLRARLPWWGHSQVCRTEATAIMSPVAICSIFVTVFSLNQYQVLASIQKIIHTKTTFHHFGKEKWLWRAPFEMSVTG